MCGRLSIDQHAAAGLGGPPRKHRAKHAAADYQIVVAHHRAILPARTAGSGRSHPFDPSLTATDSNGSSCYGPTPVWAGSSAS